MRLSRSAVSAYTIRYDSLQMERNYLYSILNSQSSSKTRVDACNWRVHATARRHGSTPTVECEDAVPALCSARVGTRAAPLYAPADDEGGRLSLLRKKPTISPAAAHSNALTPGLRAAVKSSGTWRAHRRQCCVASRQCRCSAQVALARAHSTVPWRMCSCQYRTHRDWLIASSFHVEK